MVHNDIVLDWINSSKPTAAPEQKFQQHQMNYNFYIDPGYQFKPMLRNLIIILTSRSASEVC